MAGPNDQLTAFLAEEARGATQAAPEAPPEPAAPEAAPTAPPEPQAAPAASKPDDDDGEPPAALEGEAVVPRRALEAERHKRQDWKERATKAETEREMLLKQLEEAKRAPAPVPQQPPMQLPQLPDPQQDPAGFVQAFAMRQQAAMLNERLNNSELIVREKMPAAELDAYVAEFKAEMARDPSLVSKLHSQVHPYGWLIKEVDRLRLMRDVGDDPTAYRARIEAEARAKWEAEAAARGPAVPQGSPVPQMAPSLATARSVAGRTAPAWSGEPSLEEVLAPIQNRKRRQA